MIIGMTAQVIIGAVVTIVISVFGYFLNRLIKEIDEMGNEITEIHKNSNARETRIQLLKNDLENKHSFLNEKIDLINNNVRDLIIEIRVMSKEILSTKFRNNNEN